MRHLLSATALALLVGCAPPPMEPQAGVGFQNYESYQRQQAYLAQREAQRRAAMAAAARPAPPPPPVAAPAPVAAPVTVAAAPPPPAAAPQSIASDAMAALGRPAAAPAVAAPAAAAPEVVAGAPLSALAPAPASEGAAAPAVAPQAAPAPAAAPPSFSGSNIAAFALATSHPIGQQMYRRSNPFGAGAQDRACARYPSDAMAQEAFLEAGGPERDRLNLDPDGDGYACRWDPAPFRLARQGG